MDKDKLWKLCEKMLDVEHQIEELAFKLQRLSNQLENIKNEIVGELEAEPKKQTKAKSTKSTSKKPKETAVTPTIVNEVDPVEAPKSLPEVLTEPVLLAEEDVQPEPTRPLSPKSTVPVPMGTPIEVRYCSMVISNEFEFSDTELSKSIRSIYVIEVMTETLARFYPIADQAQRLISKRAELLDPICVADRNLTLDNFYIREDAYGILEKNHYGRWNIIKQCSLL